MIELGILFVTFFIAAVLFNWDSAKKQTKEEVARAVLVAEQEEAMWEMTTEQLLMVDRDKINPENVEVLNQLILDSIKYMEPWRIGEILPKMRRFNEGFMEYAEAMQNG